MNAPLPDGFRLGAFSETELLQWLSGSSAYGSSDCRNAKVTDISWWSSHEAPWHHQFIIITVINDDQHSYSVRIDRLGKLVGLRAKQQIMIQDAIPLIDFIASNDLICALMTSFVSTNAITVDIIPRYHGFYPPTPTLGDVLTYMSMILEEIPYYHLGTYNCHFFSRVLFHVVGLRHYNSFNFLVLCSPNSLEPSMPRPPDCAWTKMMSILQERENALLYKRLSTASCRLIFFIMIFSIPGPWSAVGSLAASLNQAMGWLSTDLLV